MLADPSAIEIDAFVSNDDSITIRVHSTQPSATCPGCRISSDSLKCRYVRQLSDLPWHDVAVRLELHTRKFRCRNGLCRQKVFCERLPRVAARYARKTALLNEVLALLAFTLGLRQRFIVCHLPHNFGNDGSKFLPKLVGRGLGVLSRVMQQSRG